MSGFLRACQAVHGWLGIFVIPWVLAIGATGFYLNHAKMFTALLGQEKFIESELKPLSLPPPGTEQTARLLGKKIWPNESVTTVTKKFYKGQQSFFLKMARGTIIVPISANFYYIKTRYIRRTFGGDGELIYTKYYWKRALKDIHKTGWLGGGLGTWLADMVAIAMMVFGVTGVFMWSAPRIRRLLRRFKESPGAG
jgi:hypothetical protein